LWVSLGGSRDGSSECSLNRCAKPAYSFQAEPIRQAALFVVNGEKRLAD
jgi:hypothetical protein